MTPDTNGTPEGTSSSDTLAPVAPKVVTGGLVRLEEYDYVTERDLVKHGIVLASETVTDADGNSVTAHTVAWLGDTATVPADALTVL